MALGRDTRSPQWLYFTAYPFMIRASGDSTSFQQLRDCGRDA
jgi:hypothetical protein